MAAKKKVSPKKKKPVRKKSVRSNKKKTVIAGELKKIVVGVAILLAVCLTVAMIADIFLKPGQVKKPAQVAEKKPVTTEKKKIEPIQEGIGQALPKKPARGLKDKTARPDKLARADQAEKSITYEVFHDVDHSAAEKPKPTVREKIPKIAIIIDDIGYDKKVALALCTLNPDITFSVLPFSPFGKYISEKLHAKGAQLMLHLPMEPAEYPEVNPGPGAILSDMQPDMLLSQLKKDIMDVPYIVGVNNHMGSKLTGDSDKMNQVFTILKKENLFFIDSRTAPKSQCKASARLLRVRFAQRDVFLDNVQDTSYITGQFRQLIDVAKRHGTAIGIGHPYKATLETLLVELPKLKNRIKLVRASSLVSIPG